MTCMVKLIGGLCAGVISLFLGGYIIYLYINTQERGSSPLLLVVAAAFIISAIVCVVLTIRSRRSDMNNQNIASGEMFAKPDSESVLQKNNSLMNEYNKVATARDKLKVLEAAGRAEES